MSRPISPGLAATLPGGIGVFDTAMLFGLSPYLPPPPTILGAIVVPWLYYIILLFLAAFRSPATRCCCAVAR